MKYKGIEIKKTKSGKYIINSPINGTTRMFKTFEYLKNYIDNAEVIESHAKAMNN